MSDRQSHGGGVANLTEAMLDQELPPRILRVCDPRAPSNTTQYSFKERAFRVDEHTRSMITHVLVNGVIQSRLHPPSSHEETPRDPTTVSSTLPGAPDDVSPNSLRNQFVCNDRSSQTIDAVIRQRGVSTMPPPSCQYNFTVTQSMIHDKYVSALALSKQRDLSSPDSDLVEEPKKNSVDPVYSDQMKSSAKLMERMVNLNNDRAAYQDYKFYTDQADSFREGGSFLPLWRFQNEKTRRKQVTCVKWNPFNADLFAVSYGSYEFLKQSQGGSIAIFSLKNPKFPELLIHTDSSVCCLDWSRLRPALIAVGLYDGSVGVLDVRTRNKKLVHQSTEKDSKHADPVWEVRWTSDTAASNPFSFISISADGRMCNWTIKKSRLECELVSELKAGEPAVSPTTEPAAALSGLVSGLCFDFSPHAPEVYLVGTEEGVVYRCSRYFSNHPVATYKNHSGPVYAVKWNPFHPGTFISSSADWTVKLWSVESSGNALCSFDLNQAVGDVDWSPVSASIFAAVTADGNVFGFDLNVNRYREIACQKVVAKSGKVTRIAFNATEPVILVGDDRGVVSCLKLSPNLRKCTTDREKERNNFDKIIQILNDS